MLTVCPYLTTLQGAEKNQASFFHSVSLSLSSLHHAIFVFTEKKKTHPTSVNDPQETKVSRDREIKTSCNLERAFKAKNFFGTLSAR